MSLEPHGIVFATLPATVAGVPRIGLIAHVDTSPEAPGGDVRPIVHEAWDGRPIVLPGDPSQVLDPAEHPALAARVGHDLVTSDGTTLLGADDKAGVAAIMTALAYLVTDDAPRAEIRVGFTVDEETARGTVHFDVESFAARCAYTFDGSGAGELETETFSAIELVVTFRGVVVHPGTAKGLMVNAVKLATDFVGSLPRDTLSPETTEGDQGFVHPRRIDGDGGAVTVWLLVRDHDDARLDEHVALVRSLAEAAVASDPRGSVSIEVVEQYRNMRAALDRDPAVAAAAAEAIRRVVLEPFGHPVRGGTDGSRLTEMGLPTPNVFTGGQNYHSVKEWASVQDMAASAATAVELARVWGER